MDKNREIVLKLFKNRCIICGKVTNEVHEIVPKSLNTDWDRVENRIPVCRSCHTNIHTDGTMNRKEQLEKIRDRRLIQYHGGHRETKKELG